MGDVVTISLKAKLDRPVVSTCGATMVCFRDDTWAGYGLDGRTAEQPKLADTVEKLRI